MSHNPYAPPTAAVADVAHEPIEACSNVITACKLIWVAFGLSQLSTASDVVYVTSAPQLLGVILRTLFAVAIGFVITRWIVSKLKAGRNWMRLLITILTVIGYLCVPLAWKFYVANVFPLYASNPIKAVAALLGIIPSLWSIAMLNTARSRAWFATIKRARGAA